MTKRVYICALVFLVLNVAAQQLPQFSQYMLSQMAINPAVAGMDDLAEVRSSSRLQWLGITDAPRTYVLTLQGPIKVKNTGIGMNLFTDIVGPTRRTGFNVSYAYHLKLNKELNLSMALSAGVLQWGIDGNKITLHEEGDQQLLTTYKTALVPDFGTGFYLYKKKQFYIGFSVPQIHQARIELYEGAYKNSKIVRHYNLHGAYTFTINGDFEAEPSFLLKYERPASPKLDVGARVIYKEQVWLGGTCRFGDACAAIVGYTYQDYLLISYSYDFSIGKIRKYAGATHELVLGLKFSKRQAATWEKKATD